MQSLVSTNSGPSLWKWKFVKNSAKKLEWSIRIGNVCEMIDSFGSRENPRELVRALNLQGQAEILAPPSGKIFNQTLQRIPSFFFVKIQFDFIRNECQSISSWFGGMRSGFPLNLASSIGQSSIGRLTKSIRLTNTIGFNDTGSRLQR